MPTVESAASGVLASIGPEPGIVLAARWVADRYVRIAARTRLRHLREVGELTVPGTVVAGTATFTRGSKIVTGNAAAQAVWKTTMVGRHVRARTTWYEIEGVAGATLHLRSAYAEATATGVAYTIAARVVTLDPRVRWLSTAVVLMRRRWPLERLSLEELDRVAPSRQRVSDGASMYVEVGDRIDAEGQVAKALELYPYATNAELYHYVFTPVAPSLKIDDPLPPEVDEHVLVEGALIDAMRWRMAQATDVNMAALWRNEYRAQETRWESTINDTYKADTASDDLTLILDRGGISGADRDIRTASDHVYARWP